MIKVDFHAHPTLQPHSELIRSNSIKSEQASIWYYNPPNPLKKWLNRIFGITFSSQSNFTSAGKGNVAIMGVALYPPEISFFQQRLPAIFNNGLERIIKRYGEDKIHEIESSTYRYFNDLTEQYRFMLSCNNQTDPDGIYTCKIAKSYSDIENALAENSNNIISFFSIEGAHSLNCGYPDFWEGELSERQQNRILDKIRIIKNWEYPVLYITFCHHYYNQLCGHCKSLPDSYAKHMDQSYGLDFPFTEFGEVVLRNLLDNTDGNRILIDIKHMSVAGRQIYFEFLADMQEEEHDQIPVIYSHGGVNGRKNYSTLPEESSNPKLNPEDLCLFDCEIIAIARSGGIIGLNMDQRVMSSAANLHTLFKNGFGRSKRYRKYLRAGIFWNNVRHIAEVLNSEGLNPWDFTVLGSDFDGAINPINHFDHEKELPAFYKYLKMHIEKYLMGTECRLQLKHQISANEIIDRLTYKNALLFLKNNMEKSAPGKNKVMANA